MIQKLEELVRAGKFKEAEQSLKKVRLSQVRREEALAYAGIAVRIGQLVIAAKILNPIIRGENLLKPALPAEKIQYANLLRRLGALSEAVEILKSLNPDTYPEISLFLAYCHISQWEYKESIPHLRHYLKNATADNAGFTAYKGSVAKVNLLASLIHEESLEEARALVSELKQELNSENARLLLGNVYELTAQLEIRCQQWDQATKNLDEAALLLHHAENSAEALFIKKWRAVAETLKTGKPSENLLNVRERAFALQLWETVRDCDYYLAKVTTQFESLLHLYFGTPFSSFKNRISNNLHGQSEVPSQYVWQHDSQQKYLRNRKALKCFNLVTAQFGDKSVSLPTGQALHRLFILLCEDFYRPLPLVTLCGKLFPGDYYNPNSSPDRTRQVIKRLRQWFKQNDLGFEIQEISGAFRLNINAGFAVQIPNYSLLLSPKDLELERLKVLVPQEEFTAREAADALSTSRSETQRVLKWAVDAKIVAVEGGSRNIRYKKIA